MISAAPGFQTLEVMILSAQVLRKASPEPLHTGASQAAQIAVQVMAQIRHQQREGWCLAGFQIALQLLKGTTLAARAGSLAMSPFSMNGLCFLAYKPA